MLLISLLFCWGILPGRVCDRADIQALYTQAKERADARQPVRAMAIADSLLSILKTEDALDCDLHLWARFVKGEALELLGQTENALSLYYQLARDAEKNEAWEVAAETYISIGRTHEMISRPVDCRRNLEAAMDIIRAQDLPAVFARYAVRYSSYHRLFDNRDSARRYAQLAVEYGERYQVMRSEIDGHLLLGLLSDENELAIFHHQAAVDINLEMKNYNGAAFQKLNVASRYYQNNLQKAFQHLDTALYYASLSPENHYKDDALYQYLYDFRRRLFEAQGNVDSAYLYLQKSIEAERRANREVNQQEVSEKEIAFAIESREAQLQYEQDRAKYLRYGLFGVIGLLAILALAFVNDRRKRRFIARQKDLITSKNEELNESLRRQSLLLSEVHHRVKNNLQLVMSLLTLQGRKNAEPTVQYQFEDLSNKVRGISLIHDQLYRSGEFEKIDLEVYLQEIAGHFQALQNEDRQFTFELHSKKILLNLETVLPLGVIATELISNSIKYASPVGQRLHIEVQLNERNGQYDFCYRDNGPGYPSGTLKISQGSMGGMLIFSMVRQLRAEGRAFNEEGANFALSFQEKQVSNV